MTTSTPVEGDVEGDVQTVGGPLTRRIRRGWIIEIVVGAAIYLLYDWLRDKTTGTSAAAYRNALQVVDAEKFLGLYHEYSIQQAFLRADWFMAFWNIYYGTIHFVMPVVALGVALPQGAGAVRALAQHASCSCSRSRSSCSGSTRSCHRG